LQDWCALAYIKRKHKWQRPTVSLPFYTIERLYGNAHPCWLQMALSLDLRDQHHQTPQKSLRIKAI
jgi:hypothetical protein